MFNTVIRLFSTSFYICRPETQHAQRTGAQPMSFISPERTRNTPSRDPRAAQKEQHNKGAGQ
jgi:hypothetical protein